MSYLSQATHASLIRDPGTITHVWNSTAAIFKRDLGWPYNTKPNDLIAAAFCCITAYDLKPYGACTELELRRLLDSPAWDCDNYCIATWHLFKLLRPQTNLNMVLVGWDGGAVGNHAQLIASEDGASWLLDPTIGMIAAGITFDSLAQGKKVSYMKQPAGMRNPVYRNLIWGALARGEYKPSDLLYYFDPPQRYIDLPRSAYWATPRA